MGGRGASSGSGGGGAAGGGSSSSAGGSGGSSSGGGAGTASKAVPPALTGSEKQIAWANKLRDSYIAVMSKTHPQSVEKTVAAHADAKYWIDNRYGLGATTTQQKAIQNLWYQK